LTSQREEQKSQHKKAKMIERNLYEVLIDA